MRRKHVFCAVLVLVLALACAVPGYAAVADPEKAFAPDPEMVTEQPEPSPELVESFVPEELPIPDEPPALEEPPEPEEGPKLEEPPEPEEGPKLEEPADPEESPEPEETPEPETGNSGLVSVTVPANGKIFINPYGLPVETATGISTEQIFSETLDIVNTSEVPVIVSASVTGCVAEQSSAVYVSSPPSPDAQEKEIFLYAEFQNEDGQWSGEYDGGDNQILVSSVDTELKEVLTLDAASRGMFRLFGSTAVYPADPWCSNDEISVTIVFAFVPVIAQEDIPMLDEKQPNTDEAFTPEEPVDPPKSSTGEEPTDPPEMPSEEEPTDRPEPPFEGEPADPLEPPTEEEPTDSPEPPAEEEPTDLSDPPTEEEPIDLPERPAEEEPTDSPEPFVVEESIDP